MRGDLAGPGTPDAVPSRKVGGCQLAGVAGRASRWRVRYTGKGIPLRTPAAGIGVAIEWRTELQSDCYRPTLTCGNRVAYIPRHTASGLLQAMAVRTLCLVPGTKHADTTQNMARREAALTRAQFSRRGQLHFEAETDPAATLRLAELRDSRAGPAGRTARASQARQSPRTAEGQSAQPGRHRQLPGAGTRSYPPVTSPPLRLSLDRS